MTIDERIESIRYWLGEFETENCGYKEFAANMADDMPVILAELARKDAEIDALVQHLVEKSCPTCPCPRTWRAPDKNYCGTYKDCETSIRAWAASKAE